MNASPTPQALPLSRLLNHTADAVRAVRSGASLNEALAACPVPARPGTQALSFQVMRGLGRAQALRGQLARRAPPAWVDALLLTALALLCEAEEAGYAEHTLVDQAVEAVKQRERASSSFVNAVLRRFLREREALLAAVARDPVAQWNHPRWWIERLQRDWPEHWQALLSANNQRPPMTLRVNAARATAEAYLERLQAAGLEGTAIGPQAVRLDLPCPVSRLPGFEAGDVSVQDLAAQWAAPLLLEAEGGRLPRGARVLDACAAPGGKTAHLLELAELDLLALDSDAARLARVEDTLARLQLRAELKAADARQPEAWWDGRPFDAILMDAPCSAAGIVRRHPDVRWLRRDADIAQLAGIQRDMLEALWPLLKPGGRLLYCTCSVFKAEGQPQIDAFLQRHSEARQLAAPGHALPLPHNADVAAHPGPAAAAHDGFFYALLEKRPV
ncbi:16S rRNA (cytosine(967)-C(5))-methyltransferase RsmB [Aquabacterium sp. A7-Y]|uniref:16S rRNA (cytosine(967)-C(5))-methyltransferase RsmB n=1 Tax=Aquabacterium sp. A7-Y TaxID=1349605 RepID=UPI00223CAF1A|nr:16S rRNA (cytosine(967)-C(5))-methyltransferase RsmB [Aquabacterium sp. A7-Y]MCW7536685.1 16S rRNA (cytosine(967)-C(5))-methyltransferase RsmB [Aquabacterium sp. A7-Y]